MELQIRGVSKIYPNGLRAPTDVTLGYLPQSFGFHQSLDSSDRGPARNISYRTALDLVRELRAVTPDALPYLLEERVETITLSDVTTGRALVHETSGVGKERT